MSAKVPKGRAANGDQGSATTGPDETPNMLRDDQSGLVLLWPFLPTYFSRMGLIENNAFCSPAAATEAVGLCAFLVTRNAVPPKATFPLAQYLCGVSPISEVVCPPLSRAAQDMGTSLLTAVIQQWPQVEGTSIDGFRQTFLCREGRLNLSHNDEPDQLICAPQAYDMLLQTAPWSLNAVLLPWMEKPLCVTWG